VERQLHELKKMGAEHIFHEYASGSIQKRPELQKMLAMVSAGDTIVCTEITRLTRSVRQLCDIIAIAKEMHLKLIIGGLTIDCHGGINPMTEAMLLIVGVFASMERDLTIERVKSGILNAKAKGIRLGRPRMRPADIPAIVFRYWDRYQDGEITKMEYARLCSVSRSTIYRYIALLTDGS
jgi:DNA invertase Pin-like site-specific DNA recombinase